MPIMYGQVQAPSNTSAADTSNTPILQGKQGELVATQLHGKYYTQAYRGNLFIGSSAIGGVVTGAYNTTSQTFGLWNPAGNTKNAVLVSLDIGIISGTIILSNYVLSQTLNAGSAVATGGPITVFGAVAPQPGNIGAIAANSARFATGAAGTAATTSASTFLMTLGMSYNTTATTLNYAATMHYEFDGKVIVPPNTAIWVNSNVATADTSDKVLIWEEVPV
jgi:hypothetical protein